MDCFKKNNTRKIVFPSRTSIVSTLQKHKLIFEIGIDPYWVVFLYCSLKPEAKEPTFAREFKNHYIKSGTSMPLAGELATLHKTERANVQIVLAGLAVQLYFRPSCAMIDQPRLGAKYKLYCKYGSVLNRTHQLLPAYIIIIR